MRILIVEDEPDLAGAVKRGLEEEGFSVDLATDGRSGLFNAQSWDYDAVILDLMLPEMDGFTVLRNLREKKKTPVLILSARDGLDSKLDGLNNGADDYLTKPFELNELFARLRALIRRSAGEASPLLKVDGVEIDTSARIVRHRGRTVKLTGKEFALLEFMALRRGKLVTRSMIYDHIYDEQEDTLSNVVDVYVANLRRKFGKAFIRTRRGEGYVLP